MTQAELQTLKIAASRGPLIFGICGLVGAILFVFTSFILEEKDVECWKQIIPFYNIYIWFKAFWKPKYFYIMLCSFVGIYIFSIVAAASFTRSNTNENVISIISVIILVLVIIWYIALIVFDIMLSHKISVSFGHGVPFTIGLILLNPIFMIVLGIQSLKNGVINKIPNGRKVFIVLWTILTILFFVGIGYLYRVSLTATINYFSNMQ